MSAPVEYIVVCQQILASPGQPWTTAYNWNGERFSRRDEAVRAGWVIRDSDDFNIGVVSGNRLVSFDWMDEPIGENDEVMSKIAKALGLTFTPKDRP